MLNPIAKYSRTDPEGNRYYVIYPPDILGLQSPVSWGEVCIPPNRKCVWVETKSKDGFILGCGGKTPTTSVPIFCPWCGGKVDGGSDVETDND